MINQFTYDYFIEEIENLENLIEGYENEAHECASMKHDMTNISQLKTELYNKYGSKYGMISKAVNRRYSEEELRQIREELADTSILTLLKRFLGIGKKNEDIYAELMGKINGLLAFLEEELEKHSHLQEQRKAGLIQCAKKYEDQYKEIQMASGCSPNADWGMFKRVDEITGNIYLGDVDVSLEAEIQFSEVILRTHMPLSYIDRKIRIPYTRKLTCPVQLLYNYHNAQNLQAVQAVRSLIYQMIRMAPAYFMELHMMDAETTGSDFAELNELQQVREGDLIQLNRRTTGGNYKLVQTYFEEQTISEGLRSLDQYMTHVAEEMGAYEHLEAYNLENRDSERGKGIIPYQMVVIQNFPTGFQDEDIKILDKLIRNGQKRGISIIILNNMDRWSELLKKGSYSVDKARSLEEKLSVETVKLLDSFNLGTNYATMKATDCSSPCRLQLMRDGNPYYIKSVIQVKMSVTETDNYFPHVFPENAPYGNMDATRGLKIPFALDRKGGLMEYCLGEAMNAHGLISGGTGSGKSTLLHMLISSICMNYTPDDVEIWLADYKITEFYSYKANTPPHIGFIGLSKTSDFSYAFIDKIMNEMTRRQTVIAEADYQLKQQGQKINITNFVEYRKAFGNSAMRRLIIIIDEFHVMAQHAQLEPEYKEKLENLLSEARALGMILLFSDQAIVDGLKGLSDKGKKQIKARIAMANYEDELKETLNEKEYDKIKPYLNMETGDIAVQTVSRERDEDGILKDVTHIERGKVVYIDSEWRFNVSAKVRELYHAEAYIPDVFDDREEELVDWNEVEEWEQSSLPLHRNGERDTQIYLGRPVNLEFSMHFPILQRKGNNIMSCAGSEEQQFRIMRSVIESFGRQKDSEILIMTDPFASVYREYGKEIHALADSMIHMSIYEELEDICYQTNRLLGIMNHRGNQKKILVIWLGLDTIADLLKEERSSKPEILAEMSEKTEGARSQKREETNTKLNDLKMMQNDLSASFEKLFGSSFGKSDEEAAAEAEREFLSTDTEGEEEEESYLYNAGDDIAKLIHLGPTRNIYNLVIYDSAVSLKDYREVKTTDFNHKIAFAMSENEASDYLERANLIRGLGDHMAYYYNGRYGRKFIPYKL